MRDVFLNTGGIRTHWDLHLFSRDPFQFPYKYNAFVAEGGGCDIEIVFDFMDREEVVSQMEKSSEVFRADIHHMHCRFFQYKKGILYVLLNKNQESVFSAWITHDWKKIAVLHDYTATHGTFAFEMVGRLLFYLFISRQRIVLHGALMEYNGKGVVLSASSGTGKSTHAHVWRDEYRALIINGDRALCGKKGKRWYGYGMPWCGTSGEYINRDVPIRAIVLLQQSKTNEVQRISSMEGFQKLYTNLDLPFWDKEIVDRALDYVDDLLREVPVFLLKCRPDKDAAAVLKKEIDKL